MAKGKKKKTKKKKEKKLYDGMKVGDQKTITRTIKGQKRKLTYERVRARGKNRNLKLKIVANEPAEPVKKVHIGTARKIHAKRSDRAKTMDEKSTSSIVTTEEKWKKHPDRYDYPSVDTKK